MGSTQTTTGHNTSPRTIPDKIYPDGFLHTLVPLMKMSWPLIVSYMCQNTFGITAVFFAGGLSKYDLDAVSLANSIISVSGLSFTVGTATAFDTLFSQIFGSGKDVLAGVVLQRGLIIMVLNVVPLSAVHINIERILMATGQDPNVSKIAGDYILLFLPGCYFYAVQVALSKFLQNQNIIYPSMIFGVSSNLLNIFLHVLFVTVLDIGVRGSALAVMLSHVCLGVLTIIYVLLSPKTRYAVSGWSMAAFHDWGLFAYLAFFGCLQICIQWWSVELCFILAGIKGVTELGAQAVLFQYKLIVFMFSYGVGLAASIFIGQYLGASRAESAKTVAHVGLTVTAFMGAVFAVFLMALHNKLPWVFTNDHDVAAMTSQTFFSVAVLVAFDGLSVMFYGILRGSGRQFGGSIIAAIGNTLGLAIGATLLFKSSLSLNGIWIGLTFAQAFIDITILVYITMDSWEHQVQKALSRVDAVANGKDRVYGPLPMVTEGSPLLDDNPPSLTNKQLICRRGGYIALVFSVLAGGIVIRLYS